MRVLFGHNKDQGGHLLAGHGLSSTGGALAAYILNGVLPSYVMDTEAGVYYDGSYYDGPNQMHDHATISTRTVVDSDGLIKWALHNGLRWSNDISNAVWLVGGGASKAGGNTVLFDGTANSKVYQAVGGVPKSGQKWRFEIEARSVSGGDISARLIIRTQVSSFFTVTEEWNTFSFDEVLTGGGPNPEFQVQNGEIGTVEFRYMRFYRSDLVGMQESGDSAMPNYVETQDNAVYALGVDHDPVTGEVLGVHGEPEATNLNIYSNTLSNAWWIKLGATIGAGSGETNLGFSLPKVVEDTSNGQHFIYSTNFPVTNAAVYTLSFFVKAAERTRIRVYTAAFSNLTYILDLTTQSAVSVTGGTSPSVSFEEFSGDVWRVSITDTTTNTSAQSYVQIVQSGTTINYTGDGTSGVYAGGFQAELGSFPTSYIPTAGAAATRAAPAVSKLLSEISANLDEIVAVMEFECSDVAADAVIAALDNAGTDLIHYRAHTSQANLLVQDGGVTQADVDAGAIWANTQHRVAFKAAANDFLASVDGATAVSDTSGTMPTPTTLRLFNSSGAAPLVGIRIKKLILYTA